MLALFYNLIPTIEILKHLFTNPSASTCYSLLATSCEF